VQRRGFSASLPRITQVYRDYFRKLWLDSDGSLQPAPDSITSQGGLNTEPHFRKTELRLSKVFEYIGVNFGRPGHHCLHYTTDDIELCLAPGTHRTTGLQRRYCTVPGPFPPLTLGEDEEYQVSYCPTRWHDTASDHYPTLSSAAAATLHQRFEDVCNRMLQSISNDDIWWWRMHPEHAPASLEMAVAIAEAEIMRNACSSLAAPSKSRGTVRLQITDPRLNPVIDKTNWRRPAQLRLKRRLKKLKDEMTQRKRQCKTNERQAFTAWEELFGQVQDLGDRQREVISRDELEEIQAEREITGHERVEVQIGPAELQKKIADSLTSAITSDKKALLKCQGLYEYTSIVGSGLLSIHPTRFSDSFNTSMRRLDLMTRQSLECVAKLGTVLPDYDPT